MVHRDVEKPLNLRLVQIHRQHAVGSGRAEQVRHQLRRDRHPRLVLPVLPRVSVIRNHRGDPRRRRPPERIDHDQQLHQVLVHRIRRRLDDEDVRAANVLVDLKRDLAVREPSQPRLSERDPEAVGDLLRQLRVGAAGKHFQVAESRRQKAITAERSSHRSIAHYRKPWDLHLHRPRTRGGDLASRRTSVAELVGAGGFEPPNTGSKVPRLTAWPRPTTSPRRPGTEGSAVRCVRNLLESLSGGGANP